MRIADISSSYSMVKSLTNLKSTQNLLSNELITGKRINSLQDDASLAQKLLNSQVTREKLIQQNNNITLCDNIASASVDSLEYIDDELDLATTVSESAMSVTESNSDAISAYAGQIDDILEEVLSMANQKYGDDYLFAGDASGSSDKPYSYQSVSDNVTKAIEAAKAATSDGTTYDTETAAAAASIQTELDSALAEVNATDADGNSTYGGQFSDADGDGVYTFDGTATTGTDAICAALNSISTLQSTVSTGGSVGDTITTATTAGETASDYGRYVSSGSGDGREIKVADGVEMSPFADEDGQKAILQTLNSLVDLRNAIASTDKDAISAATEKLSIAQDAIVDATSDISTTQSRLSLLADRNAADYTNLDDAEEAATNASEEETTVKLLASQQAYSAALQGTSLLLEKSLLDYL